MISYDFRVKILCVDDERNVLRSLERIFLDDDYEIVLASSGEEGLQIIEADREGFQIVISDYRMPVMTGVQFLKKVYDISPDTVRIVLSGYADAAAIVEAINEGHIYKFIPKPWNDEDLRFTIQSSLERYSLLKKNRELLKDITLANADLKEKINSFAECCGLMDSGDEFATTLLQNLPVGVLAMSAESRIIWHNPEAAKLLDETGVTIAEQERAFAAALCSGDSSENSSDLLLGSRSFRIISRASVVGGRDVTIVVLIKRTL